MRRSTRDLEQGLLDEFGRLLSRFGFSSRPREQTFLKPIDRGKVAAHLSFIRHGHDFDVTADVAIRFDEVEKLVNATSSLLSDREKSQTFTLGAELGNIRGDGQCRVTVAEAEDVGRAARDLASMFESVGLPYVNRYSSREAAYDALSGDDREAWLHCPFDAERAKRACALLVALGRHSEIEPLAKQKLRFLESMGDPGAATFADFISRISGG